MKRFLLIFFTLATCSVYAQSGSLGNSDPLAKALLRKVSAKYKSYNTISAEVSLQIENNQGKNLSSQKGNLLLKGSRYYLKMNEDVSFSDGSNIYNFDKDANEVQITKANPQDNLITPQKLFTNFYDKDYLYRILEEKKMGSVSVKVVELTPTDKTLPFFKVLLNINDNTNQIVSAQVFDKSGNRYLYKIESMKTNQPVAESQFTFSKNRFPGAEVVDLR